MKPERVRAGGLAGLLTGLLNHLRGRPARRMLGLLGAAALAIGAIGALTDIDLALADAMYDRAGAVFPWRHAWLAEVASHVYLKVVLSIAGGAFMLAAAWDGWRPIARWKRPLRMQVRCVALSALLVPLVIAMLKQASSSHCPWDLAMYGGAEQYVRLLESALPGVSRGHCLPAGHASTALWLPSLAVFFLPGQPRRAAAVAALLFAVGFGVGWLQQLRGAHFLTHTLWSMWWAAAIIGTLLLPAQAVAPASVAESAPGSADSVS